MSTQIRFRLSGEEEQNFLEAARRAGLSPDAYARVRALAPVDPMAQLPKTLEERLAAIESKLASPPTTPGSHGPATLISGMDARDLILAVRRETRQGVSAFLVLLDGEPLPDVHDSSAPANQSS